MWDGLTSLEIMLRGAAVGALVATAIVLGRSRASPAVRLSGLLFAIAVIGYVVNSSASSRAAVGDLHPLFRALSYGGIGAFWAFVLAIFEDRRLSPSLLAPFVALTVYGIAASFASAGSHGVWWIVHNVIEVGLAAHALFVVYRSWRGDLVDPRRRLRGPSSLAWHCSPLSSPHLKSAKTSAYRPAGIRWPVRWVWRVSACSGRLYCSSCGRRCWAPLFPQPPLYPRQLVQTQQTDLRLIV